MYKWLVLPRCLSVAYITLSNPRNPPLIPSSLLGSILQVTCTVIRPSAFVLLPLMKALFIILHLVFGKCKSSGSQWIQMSFFLILPRCENFGCIWWNHVSTSLCACNLMLPQYGSSLLSIPVHLCLPWTYWWNRNQVSCKLYLYSLIYTQLSSSDNM